MLKPLPVRAPARPRARQRGLSLVELMVGIAIGLFVVAAGILGVTTSLRENRQLLLEARLQQDLRAAMDLITRDTRRAGYWGNSVAGIPTAAASATSNPHAAITVSTMPTRPTPVASTTPVSLTGEAASEISYRWDEDGDGSLDSDETYAFGMNEGKIRMRIGGGGWQYVTDSAAMEITSFSVTPAMTWLPLYDKCASACDPTAQNCPELAIRTLAVEIAARSPDGSVQRTLRSNVRVRNDQLLGACP